MSGDNQTTRVSAAQVATDLEETRKELAEGLAEVRDELADVREQLGEHAAALKPRLDRLARRRAAAADDK